MEPVPLWAYFNESHVQSANRPTNGDDYRLSDIYAAVDEIFEIQVRTQIKYSIYPIKSLVLSLLHSTTATFAVSTES